MAKQEVTHGGGGGNIKSGVVYGFKRFFLKIWAWGHNDQRASWLMHGLICIAASLAFAFLVTAIDAFGRTSLFWYSIMASVMFVVFLFRETGDEDYWRRKGMWDVLDKDTNWRGKIRLGVSRRFDKIGDLLGPLFNFVVAWAAYWVATW